MVETCSPSSVAMGECGWFPPTMSTARAEVVLTPVPRKDFPVWFREMIRMPASHRLLLGGHLALLVTSGIK